MLANPQCQVCSAVSNCFTCTNGISCNGCATGYYPDVVSPSICKCINKK